MGVWGEGGAVCAVCPAGPAREPGRSGGRRQSTTLLPSPPSASLSGPCREQGLDQSRTQGSGLPSQQHVVLTAPIPNFHTVRPTLCQMLLCTSQQNTSKSPKACSGGLGCHVQVHDQTQRKVNIPHRLPRWLPPAAWTGPAAPTPSLLCSIVRRAASEPGGSLCPGLPHLGRPPTQQHVPKSTSPIFQPTANPEAPQQGRPSKAAESPGRLTGLFLSILTRVGTSEVYVNTKHVTRTWPCRHPESAWASEPPDNA